MFNSIIPGSSKAVRRRKLKNPQIMNKIFALCQFIVLMSKVIQNSTYKTIVKEILSFSILLRILVVKLSP